MLSHAPPPTRGRRTLSALPQHMPSCCSAEIATSQTKMMRAFLLATMSASAAASSPGGDENGHPRGLLVAHDVMSNEKMAEAQGAGVPGFCEAVYGPGDCSGASSPVGGHHKGLLHFDHSGGSGFIYTRLDSANHAADASSCIEACRACERCNFVSFSPGFKFKCSWFEFCALDRLQQRPGQEWRTYQVKERPLVEQLQLSPRIAPTPNVALRAFASRLGPPRRGKGGVSSSSSSGSRSGSQLALHKPNEPLLIVVYGTSVSMGEGPTSASWLSAFPDLLEGKLRRAFPQLEGRPLRVVKRAYPGTTSSLLRHCIGTLLPEQADLYILEFVGYLGDNVQTKKTRANLVSILQTLRARCGGVAAGTRKEQLHPAPHVCRRRPAVMQVAPLDQGSCVRSIKGMGPMKPLPSALAEVRACVDSESGTTATQEELGRTLDVPTISLRKVLRRPMLRNAPGAKQLLNRLTIDYVHFTRAGHELASELLTRAIVAAARLPLNSTEQRTERMQSQPVVAAAPTTCAFGDDLRPLILRSGGWEHTLDVSKRGQPKPGLVATQPGATLDLCYEHATPVRSTWSLAFLTAPRRLGKVRGTCLHGCRCPAKIWDAHLPMFPNSEPRMDQLAITAEKGERKGKGKAACPCTVRLTVLNETSSGTHKFKLLAVLSGMELNFMDLILSRADQSLSIGR